MTTYLRTCYRLTGSKVDDNAIDSSEITASSILSSDLTSSCIASRHVGADAIVESAIVDEAVTADKLQTSAATLSNLLAAGSFNSSADDSDGTIAIAHGLATTPTSVGGMILGVTAGVQKLSLKAAGATNLTFYVSSCPLTTVDAVASSITANFLWHARL